MSEQCPKCNAYLHPAAVHRCNKKPNPKPARAPRELFITEFPNINNQMIPFHAFGSKEKALDDAGRSGRVVEVIEKAEYERVVKELEDCQRQLSFRNSAQADACTDRDTWRAMAEELGEALKGIEDVARMHVETFKQVPMQGMQQARDWMPVLNAIAKLAKLKEGK